MRLSTGNLMEGNHAINRTLLKVVSEKWQEKVVGLPLNQKRITKNQRLITQIPIKLIIERLLFEIALEIGDKNIGGFFVIIVNIA